jgi:hypothetical protein
MRFAFTSDETAHAYFPGANAAAGDLWFGRDLDGFGIRGGYAYLTVLHEIGHAIGLKHPHQVSGPFDALPVDRDSIEFSVMSYRSHVGAPADDDYRSETWGFAQGPMIYDIAALQHLYGANFKPTRAIQSMRGARRQVRRSSTVSGRARQAATACSRRSGTAAVSTPTTSPTTRRT